MNNYIVQHKIKTISSLAFDYPEQSSFTFENISFFHWEFNYAGGFLGNAWVACGKENAENFADAINNFRDRLEKIVPKIAFISQCYMDFASQSFLVHKENDNPDNVSFVRGVFESESVGLMFMKKELKSLTCLNEENIETEFYWYMNDCYNTTGYTAKLLLLFASLENLAGKETKMDAESGNIYTTYNKEQMKDILGNDLFNKIYGQNGLRHKLSHGSYPKFRSREINYVEEIHNKILSYFNRTYENVSIQTGITHPQRHPYGNLECGHHFIKPRLLDGEYQVRLQDILLYLNETRDSDLPDMKFEDVHEEGLEQRY